MARAGRVLGAAAVVVVIAVGLSGTLFPAKPRTSNHGQRVLENTSAGDRSRYTITESTEDTKGAYLKIRELARPGIPGFTPGRSGSPPRHIHNTQEECFIVHSGIFSYEVDGLEGRLKPGDKQLCIPAGKPHQFWNGDNTTAMDMEFTLTPAGTFEPFIRTFTGLATDAGTIENVNPLQVMVLFPYGDMQLAEMPKPVWLIIEHVLVPVLRVLNIYQPVYPEYVS